MQKKRDAGTDNPKVSTGRPAMQLPEPMRLIEGLSGLDRLRARKLQISSKITEAQIDWYKKHLRTEM
jgi:hypothetical protein